MPITNWHLGKVHSACVVFGAAHQKLMDDRELDATTLVLRLDTNPTEKSSPSNLDLVIEFLASSFQ